MALNLGELSIALELENDKFRAGMAAAKKELETLPPSAQREMVRVSRVMDEEGRKSGGTLAKGINAGLIRNSPLIVAGVGAALAAGAPVMLAAAGTLFAGIGAVAASQSLEVREAWSELGQGIRDGAVEDAAVLVPIYTQMAGEIGAAFQRLRPQLRDAFEASAPLVESFTDGVIDLGENAMPGLVRAVQSAGPVFAGLQAFLAATGTGLTEFFDAMSDHSPAAGAALAALGDIFGDLLPVLGELLGQGAELAADVLPAVAGATSVALEVLQALGPALPAIAAGFAAFKAAQVAAGYLQTFAVQAQFATMGMSGSVAAGARMGGAISAIGRSLPLVGAGVVALVHAFASMNSASEAATTAQGVLRTALEATGGAIDDNVRSAAAKAAEDAGLLDIAEKAGIALDDVTAALTGNSDAYDRVNKGLQDYITANPGGHHNKEAEAARQARIDLDELAGTVDESADAQRRHQEAVQGATVALVEQAAQALAMIDSGFAYRKSLDELEDAQAHLADTMAHRNDADEAARTSAEDVQRAQLALEMQARSTAEAFGRQQADLSGLTEGSDAYKRFVNEQMLGELYRLQAASGPEMAAAIGQQISALEASGVALATTGTGAAATAERMRQLGLKVTEIPGNKTIIIDAPTEDQRRRLKELGLIAQTMPNGKIIVVADTSPAAGTLAAFMNQRRVIQLQAIVSTGAARTALGGLGGGGGLQERAAGGPVWPGQTFLVGEEGPEMVRFAGRGEVIPADQTAAITRGAQPAASVTSGGGSGVVINDNRTVNAYGLDEAALSRRMRDDQRDREFLAWAR